MDEAILQSLIKEIRKCIEAGSVDNTSALTLISKTMELAYINLASANGLTRKKYVMAALSEVAKGADNVEGTADDLIPAKTLIALKTMVESDLLEQTINTIYDVAKGRITIIQAVEPVARSCFSFCLRKAKAKASGPDQV